MAIGLVVGGIQHGAVGMWFAQLNVRLEELLVAVVQQIDLGIVQRRIGVGIPLAIQITQEAGHFRSTLRGEFAVEDNDVALVSRFGVLLLLQLSLLDGEELIEDLLGGVQVLGSLDVAALEFVGVAAVDDAVAGHLIAELALKQASHCFAGDALQIPMTTLHQGQGIGFAEVAD